MNAQARYETGALVADRYQVLAELASGGTANVYLAAARGPAGFNKLVVLKVPRSDVTDEPSWCDAFLREARVAARLNHPNIVQTFEVTVHEGWPVIVMEYLRGEPLSTVIAQGAGTSGSEPGQSGRRALPLGHELRVLVEVLRGLHHAHELVDYDGRALGLVHRDVSPQNVFVTCDGQIKLLDFGLAKLGWIEEHSRSVVGKLRYMPPEQLLCQPLDRRADLFAVGVMLWEGLAEQRLWQGRSPEDIEASLLDGNIPPPSVVNPAASPQLEAVCMRALASNREERYPTAAAFERALMAATDGAQHLAEAHEVGETVAHLFREKHETRDRLLQNRLASVSLATAPQNAEETSPPFTPRPLHASARPPSTTQGRSRGWRTALGAALGLAAVIALAYLSQGRALEATARPPLPSLPAPSVVPASSQKPVPNAQPSTVNVRVRATPPHARLFFDGDELGTNPVQWSAPRDGSRHQLRAEAPGFQPRETEVVLEQNVNVELALARLAPAAAPRRGARAKPEPAPSAKPVVPDCSEPSYVDRYGIKRYRPECLGQPR